MISPEQYEAGDLASAEAERRDNDEHDDYLDAVQFGPVPEEDPVDRVRQARQMPIWKWQGDW